MNAKKSSILATALLLTVSLASLRTTRASEPLPKGFNRSTVANAKEILSYQDKSKAALATLTRYVRETEKGDKDLAYEWNRLSTEMLSLLNQLNDPRRTKGWTPELRRWWSDEVQAWRAVQKIGGGMIALHHRMAFTTQEIQYDVKDSTKYLAAWKNQVDSSNDLAKEIKLGMKAIEATTDNFELVSKIAGEVSGNLGKLSLASHTLSRVIVRLRARQTSFIKSRGDLERYRVRLNALRNEKLDPDGTGVFYEREIAWEKTMLSTYETYVRAVSEWNEAHKLFDKSQAIKLVKWGVGAATKFAGCPFPVFYPGDEEKLADRCAQLAEVFRKGMSQITGAYWYDLQKLVETELEELNSERGRAIEETAKTRESRRTREEAAEKERDTLIEKLKARSEEITRKIDRLGRESPERDALSRELNAIASAEDNVERGFQKSLLFLKNWEDQEINRITKERDAKLKEIEARIREHDGKLAKLR